MANIQDKLNNIKNALFGKDVRNSIHDGIDAINKEVESTTGRQVDLESTFDQLVINAGNSNAEIVDARVQSDGTSYKKLGDRLNGFDEQFNTKANQVDLEVQKSRIDLLTKIESGQTEGNTELLDIRIGADASEYASAGDSVRKQINNVNYSIQDIKKFFKTEGKYNLLDYLEKTTIENTFITWNGTYNSSTSYDTYILYLPKGQYAIYGKIRLINAFDNYPNNTTMVANKKIYDGTTTQETIFTLDISSYVAISFYKTSPTLILNEGDYVYKDKPNTILKDIEIELNNDNINFLLQKSTENNIIVKKDDTYLYIKSRLENGMIIVQRMIFSNLTNGLFNYYDTQIVNSWESWEGTIVHICYDDMTPVRTFNTVGANHGYTCILNVQGTHDKTTHDLGSVWSDGVTEYVLLDINTNLLTLGCPYILEDSEYKGVKILPVSNLHHVSSATNVSEIDVSTILTGLQQLQNICYDKNLEIYLDEKRISKNGEYEGENLVINYNYTIMSYKGIIDTAKENVGKNFRDYCRNPYLTFALNLQFKTFGESVLCHSIKSHEKISFADCGFIQSGCLNSENYTLYRYIPNVKPKGAWDLSNLTNMTDYATSIVYSNTDLIDSNFAIDRYVEWLKNSSNNKLIGFTMGYLDIGDASNEKRKTLSRQFDMRNTKKNYPIAMTGFTMQPNEFKTVFAYRKYLCPTDLTNRALISVADNKYIYIDSHEQTLGHIKYENELIGKEVKEVQNVNCSINNIYDCYGIRYNFNDKGYVVAKL